MKPFTCPTCKMDIVSETMHGWVRDRNFGIETGWKQRILPCPTCSEQANARRMAENIARLMGKAHIPWRMQDWHFGTTPGDVDQTAAAVCANFSNQQVDGRGLYLLGQSAVASRAARRSHRRTPRPQRYPIPAYP